MAVDRADGTGGARASAPTPGSGEDGSPPQPTPPRRPRRPHLKRYRQIAEVLIRHGLGSVAGVLGLKRFLPLHRGASGPERPEITPPQHLRLALEELGSTFIKLGQVLSTHPDLLGPDYIRELSRLQDAAPPVPASDITQAIEAELGMPVRKAFAHFEHEPLAAASIGQAHAATLKQGGERLDVVVKVRRPGAVEQVNEDIEILGNLAAAATRRWPDAAYYDPVGLVDEFAAALQAELDYIREGRNAERFARDFEGDDGVHIPRVFWERTTSRVLTMERLRGIKIDDLAALDAAGIDRKALAKRAVRLALLMIFEHGFFHADPHPGNFFVEPDGRIGLIDFGMTGTVDEATRERFARMLVAFTDGDADALVEGMLDITVAGGRIDRKRLTSDVDDLLSRYRELTLGEIRFGTALEQFFAILRRQRLRLPSNLALLCKTLVMAEGMGARLDPEFQLLEELRPYAERLLLQQYSPLHWAGRIGKASVDAARLAVELPGQLRRIVEALDSSNLEFGIRQDSVQPVVDRLERIANRLVLGILDAAFIIGLAVLTLIYHPAGWERGAGVAFGLGFVVAAVLGVYLAWTILRPGSEPRSGRLARVLTSVATPRGDRSTSDQAPTGAGGGRPSRRRRIRIKGAATTGT